jgi:DNA-binding MarR family transcriptional regulator
MSGPTSTQVLKAAVRPPHELVDSTTFLLKRLGGAIKEEMVEAFRAAGESPSHYSVLALLDESACGTQANIADVFGYDRSWLVGLLDELEEQGLIERRRDPADRRRHLVSLKPAGREKLAQLRTISRSVEDEFLAPLDADQRTQLHELLLRLTAHHDPRYAPGAGQEAPA